MGKKEGKIKDIKNSLIHPHEIMRRNRREKEEQGVLKKVC
jgi:hypothetical protein